MGTFSPVLPNARIGIFLVSAKDEPESSAAAQPAADASTNWRREISMIPSSATIFMLGGPQFQRFCALGPPSGPSRHVGDACFRHMPRGNCGISRRKSLYPSQPPEGPAIVRL